MLQNGGKWFEKDYNPTMPKRPTCQYRDWERIIKRDEDGEGTLIVIRKDYNCTTGTQPSIQDVCKFFDLDWLCLSDKDRENEDEWTQKEWKDLPPTHPCKCIARSQSDHSPCPSNATNILRLWSWVDYTLWDFKNPDPLSGVSLKDQSIPGFETYTPEADFTELEEGDNLLSPRVSLSDEAKSLIKFRSHLLSTLTHGINIVSLL